MALCERRRGGAALILAALAALVAFSDATPLAPVGLQLTSQTSADGTRVTIEWELPACYDGMTTNPPVTTVPYTFKIHTFWNRPTGTSCGGEGEIPCPTGQGVDTISYTGLCRAFPDQDNANPRRGSPERRVVTHTLEGLTPYAKYDVTVATYASSEQHFSRTILVVPMPWAKGSGRAQVDASGIGKSWHVDWLGDYLTSDGWETNRFNPEIGVPLWDQGNEDLELFSKHLGAVAADFDGDGRYVRARVRAICDQSRRGAGALALSRPPGLRRCLFFSPMDMI